MHIRRRLRGSGVLVDWRRSRIPVLGTVQTRTVQTAPTVPGATSNGLTGITCKSATECKAVGTAWDGNLRQTLLEELRRKTEWTVVPSANRSGGDNYLGGVSCVEAGTCFAVGGSYGGGPETLIETNLLSPTIASSASDTFVSGRSNLFGVTTGGFPIPAVLESGRLPARCHLRRQRKRHGNAIRHPCPWHRRHLPDHHHGHERDRPRRHTGLHPDRPADRNSDDLAPDGLCLRKRTTRSLTLATLAASGGNRP